MNSATRWRSTLYEICSSARLCPSAASAALWVHVGRKRGKKNAPLFSWLNSAHCEEKHEAVSSPRRALHGEPTAFQLFFIHFWIFSIQKHFSLMSTCIWNCIPITFPWSLAVCRYLKSIILCSPCAQLLQIIRYQAETRRVWRFLYVLQVSVWGPRAEQANTGNNKCWGSHVNASPNGQED